MNIIRVDLRERVVCKDGFEMSVQWGYHHCCSPKKNNKKFAEMESLDVGYPSEPENALQQYEDSDNHYGNVPREVVEDIISKHGGLIAPKDFYTS